MGHLQNLDIHEFLASLGRKAVTKATQGISSSQSKQSKSSDIVFVEDTDEYTHLSTDCVFAGREENGFSAGGGWKTRGSSYVSETSKKEVDFMSRNSAPVKNNFGRGENKEQTQVGGWEANMCSNSNFGWGEENGSADRGVKGAQAMCDTGWGEENESVDGWAKGMQENCSDGWGEETNEVSEGWKQGKDIDGPDDTECQKQKGEGTRKAGNGIGWECSEHRENKRLWGEKGAWSSEDTSIGKGNDGGWGVDKKFPTGWVRGNQKEESTKDGQGGSINEGNIGRWDRSRGASDGWGNGRHVSASDGVNRSSQDEGALNKCKTNVLQRSPGGQKSSLQQESNAGWGEDKDCAAGWEKTTESNDFSGWECGAHEKGTPNGWGSSSTQKHADKGLSGGWRESGDWGKHSQTLDASAGTGNNALKKTNGGWGKEQCDTADGWQEERKCASDRWGQGNQKSTSVEWGRKNLVPGRWRGDGSKERVTAGGGWGENVSGWSQKTKATAERWGQGSQQDFDDKWVGGVHMKTDSGRENDSKEWRERQASGDGWEKDTLNETNDGWGEKQGLALRDGWDTGGQKEAGNGWGNSIEKKIDAGWVESKAVNIRGSEGEKSDLEEGAQTKHVGSGWGEESQSPLGEWRSGGGVPCTGWEKEKEGKAQNGIVESEKAKEDARGGWEQGSPEKAAAGWEGTDDGRSQAHDKKDVDLVWGQEREHTVGNWEERGEDSTCQWSQTAEERTRARQGNKSTACRWNNHSGWESRAKEESNARWGASTIAGASSGGWVESKDQGAIDGWGDLTQDKSNPGWGSSHDSIASEGNLTQSILEGGLVCANAGAGDDICGWNQTSEKHSGWETGTEGWKPQSQRSTNSGRNACEWSEALDADKRRSGTFGPSGSNTVPLGKRKGTGTMDLHKNLNQGTSSQLNHPASQQDQRQWPGKRLNNGYAGTPRREFASYSSQIHNRRQRLLKTLISLPEYPEMDELYKATNRVLHHSGYQAGDRLNPEDEKFILENILAHHREKDVKLGCGLDHIMIDYHADHQQVSCFWVVRTDGSKIDFSYWKCLEHLFDVKYPHILKEALEEESKDSIAMALHHESSQAKEETKELEASIEEAAPEEKLTQQKDDDGW